MKNTFKVPMQSLTLDNDTAFAQHEHIESEMKTKVYFCEPYKSYQKGGIENANRLLRTKFLLQTDKVFTTIISLWEMYSISFKPVVPLRRHSTKDKI